MKLRFCAKFHHSGIKAVAHCRNNQPDVWSCLCRGLAISSGLISGFISLYFYHLSNKKAIKRFCVDCEDLWNSGLKTDVLPVLEMIFNCQIEDTILCYVGLYPTYLRSIRGHYFLLPYGVSNNRLREVIIHELSHFYCYKACGNRFTSDKLWRLSESIVPYMLKSKFNIDCSEFSYAGNWSNPEKALFRSWANGEISFEKFLDSLRQYE